MSERFDRFFVDLEHAATGYEQHQRMAELPDRISEEFAERALIERLCGALGSHVVCTTMGVAYEGTLSSVGADWIGLSRVDASGRLVGGALSADAVDCIVLTRAIDTIVLRTRSHREPGLKLSVRSPLRQWVQERVEVRLTLLGGATAQGVIEAVASDYVQLRNAGGSELVPLHRIAVARQLALDQIG